MKSECHKNLTTSRVHLLTQNNYYQSSYINVWPVVCSVVQRAYRYRHTQSPLRQHLFASMAGVQGKSSMLCRNELHSPFTPHQWQCNCTTVVLTEPLIRLSDRKRQTDSTEFIMKRKLVSFMWRFYWDKETKVCTINTFTVGLLYVLNRRCVACIINLVCRYNCKTLNCNKQKYVNEERQS